MEELRVLDAEVRSCHLCRLGESRKRAVPGEGDPRANVLFIGEAPGYHENEQGRPFVGPAGKLLDELLASIQLKRQDVYITNVLKCRPPNNRDPQPDELAACHNYLQRQIALIQPRLIVTLGRFSMGKFFPPGPGITRLHGTTVRHGRMLCLAMYHPAAALRNPAWMQSLQEDFRKIPELLAQVEAEWQAEPPAQGGPEDPPEQLPLF